MQKIQPTVTIGSIIRDNRHACGLAAKHVAEQLGITHRSLRYWENSHHLPGQKYLERLIEFLEIPPRDVIRMKRLSLGLEPESRHNIDVYWPKLPGSP